MNSSRQFARQVLLVVTIPLLSACSGTPSGPTPLSQPQPALDAAPQPPFSVRGAVYDGVGRPLPDALVEILDGSHAGATTATDAAGAFAFGQTFTAVVHIRASKPNYTRDERRVDSAEGTSGRLWLKLTSAGATPSLGGRYRVTFTADEACTTLPAALRTRTYEASISPATFQVVVLTGPPFVAGTGVGYDAYNVVYLSQDGDAASFQFQDPEIIEKIGNYAWLAIFGGAVGTMTEPTTVLPAWAGLTYCSAGSYDGSAACHVPLITCQSDSHRLTVTRQ